MLTQLLPPEEIDARTPYVLARLRECLSPRDQRVRTAEAELLHCDVASHRRAALANAMRTVYTIADQQHARVRSFKNALIVGTIVLALVVVGVVTVGYSAPSAIPLCFNPTLTTATQQPPQSTTGQQQACPAGKGHPAPGDVGLVALLGLLGGALSAAVAVRKLSGTSTPYAVPITLSVLKLPFGALTAVAGLLLLHGQFVPGLSELDSQGQILAYAVVLGVAQQVATQFVDRRAHEVLSMQPTPQGHGEQPPSPESSINRHHAYDHGAASPDGEDRP